MDAITDTRKDSSTPPAAERLGSAVKSYTLAAGRPPLFIEPVDEALKTRDGFRRWAEDVRPLLDELIVEHGGIFLRGFPFPGTEDFRWFTELFPAFSGGYFGGIAPRAQISGGVMEATRLSADVTISPHSEMAYMSEYPKRIAFYSHQTAPIGGETMIVDVRGMVEELPPELVEKMDRLGIRTTRNYGPKSAGMDGVVKVMDEIGWNVPFGTDSKEEVNRLCSELNLEPHWNEDDSLTIFNYTDPFVTHPATGQRLYRSVLHVFVAGKRPQGEDPEAFEKLRQKQKSLSGTALGDGEPLNPNEIEIFEKLIEKRTIEWRWQDGDVMILDNIQVWHGRRPFKGDRNVQVALLG